MTHNTGTNSDPQTKIELVFDWDRDGSDMFCIDRHSHDSLSETDNKPTSSISNDREENDSYEFFANYSALCHTIDRIHKKFGRKSDKLCGSSAR